jgi:hypothetical protein
MIQQAKADRPPATFGAISFSGEAGLIVILTLMVEIRSGGDEQKFLESIDPVLQGAVAERLCKPRERWRFRQMMLDYLIARSCGRGGPPKPGDTSFLLIAPITT